MNRLFEIVLLLLDKEKMTAKELAKHFEVSQRTILRDIDKLLVAGIPIITHTGYQGGISIDERFHLTSKLIAQEEKEAIIQGLQAIDSIRSSPLLPKILTKLLDTTTISYNEMIDIDLSSWYGTSITNKIESIKQAIINHHKLSFLYVSNKGEGNKLVAPIKIVFRWSSWYLVGICDKAKAVRFYKLNRMSQIIETNQIFQNQDIECPIEEYFEEVNYQLVAVFDSAMKYRLVDEYGLESFIEKNGKLYFQKDFVSKEYMISWILSYGSNVEVVEPTEIKEEIKIVIENMKKVYEYDI